MCTDPKSRDPKSRDLKPEVEELHKMIAPLRQGAFSESLGKVLVYVDSSAKSLDSASAALKALEEKRSKDPGMDPEKYRQERVAISSRFIRSLENSLAFARRNLDSVLAAATEELVHRPRLASKTDLEKRAQALQKSFDRMDDPAVGMLEHFKGGSDPLNKYLVAGPWGHDYLHKRGIDPAEYNRRLCQTLGCQDTAYGRVLLSYSPLTKAIDRVETCAREAMD